MNKLYPFNEILGSPKKETDSIEYHLIEVKFNNPIEKDSLEFKTLSKEISDKFSLELEQSNELLKLLLTCSSMELDLQPYSTGVFVSKHRIQWLRQITEFANITLKVNRWCKLDNAECLDMIVEYFNAFGIPHTFPQLFVAPLLTIINPHNYKTHFRYKLICGVDGTVYAEGYIEETQSHPTKYTQEGVTEFNALAMRLLDNILKSIKPTA